MNIETEQLASLKKAVAGLCYRPFKETTIGANELRDLGLVYAHLNADGCTGFDPDGASAVSMLASDIYKREECYKRGAEFGKFRVSLANFILPLLGVEAKNLSINDLARIKTKLSVWFQAESFRRTHYIPCTIIPYEANSFSVGPVSFVHASVFWQERPNPNYFSDDQYKEFLRALEERHGCWIAVVDVVGAEENRSSELANLATDLALCALHLVMPQDVSQRMARINGRTWPAWSCSLFCKNQSPSFKFNNAQPGRTMLPEGFGYLITAQQLILDSIGCRISSFLDLNNPMDKLEKSWCDAAYWFHEALAEPMDTIAIAKLETIIEVLLMSESSKGSKIRIKNAFLAFLGLKESDSLSNGMTVNSYSEMVVTARSRVLHGTWSTLNNEMPVSREDISLLAFLCIRAFTLNLDLYLKELPKKGDNVKEFLEWVISFKGQSAVSS
jgi:hypothetical protein